jgi:GntR family transcriptional regulator
VAATHAADLLTLARDWIDQERELWPSHTAQAALRRRNQPAQDQPEHVPAAAARRLDSEEVLAASSLAVTRFVLHRHRQAQAPLRLRHVRDHDPVVGDRQPHPNTVLKAYRELEHLGLITARPGVGTFVTRTLAGESLGAHEPLRLELQAWLDKALRAGLDADSIEALFTTTFRKAIEVAR